MASSGTIKSSVYRSHLWLTFNWSQSSQSIANNTTTISWNLKLHWDASISFSASKSYTVTVNGTKYTGNYTGGATGSSGSATIRSGTTTISHNTDGTKSFSVSATFNIDITWLGTKLSSMSLSGNGSLNAIARKSSISVSSGDGTKPGAGNIVLSISRASTSFTHTVTWACAGLSGTIGTGLTTSASWAVPMDIISKSPNASQTVTFTCTTYNGNTNIGSTTCTATVRYYGPSTVSASSGSTIGSSKSFTISRGNANFTHSMWYSFGSKTWQVIGSSLSTSASFTPPMSLCSEIPNASSGSMTIILRTYYGNTQIGSDQYYYYTMNVPASVVPTMNSVTCVDTVDDVKNLVGAYVQNKSKLSFAIVGATGSYGSTIKSYKIVGCGYTINAVSGATGVVTVSGPQTITATITDSRGRTAIRTLEINILAYLSPKISGVGVERAEDTIANASASLQASSLKVDEEEKNLLRYKIEYKSVDAYGYTELEGSYQTLKQDMSRSITGLDANKSYEFRIYVGDIFGYNTAFSQVAISTAFKSFDFDIKTGRLGIKKVLEHEDSVIEVPDSSKMYVGNKPITIEHIIQVTDQYRVGDIIITVNSENPSVRYGGTWELLCPGRTLVCIDTGDSDFSTVKKTGGSKYMQQHNHSASTSGAGAHTPSGTIAGGDHRHQLPYTGYRFDSIAGTTNQLAKVDTTNHSHYDVANTGGHSHTFTGTAVPAHTHTVTVGNAGTGTSQNLQPYMAVYMWVKIK